MLCLFNEIIKYLPIYLLIVCAPRHSKVKRKGWILAERFVVGTLLILQQNSL